jgi:hypothetical protein
MDNPAKMLLLLENAAHGLLGRQSPGSGRVSIEIKVSELAKTWKNRGAIYLENDANP